MSERYEILEKLGEDTHLARDKTLGRKVVIRAKANPDVVKKASEVAHPHLATILDLFEHPELGHVVVYEHIGGPTLRERIPQVMSPTEIAKLATEIGSALSVVHEAGLAHGAVVPENIRFSKSGAKLTGLGSREGTAGDDQRAFAAMIYEAFARKPATTPHVRLSDLDDARSPILRARLDAALARTFEGKLYSTCRDLGAMVAGAVDPPHSGAFPMLRAAELEARSRQSIVPRPVRRAQNIFAGIAVIIIVLLVLFGRRSQKEDPKPPPKPAASIDAGRD